MTDQNILTRVATLLDTIKFSHSIFALPFALFACFLAAEGWPGTGRLILIVLCMVFVRSASMSYNRLADHGLDKHNPRTADRALPAGKLSRTVVWGFALVTVFGAFATCYGFRYFFNNSYPIILLPILLAYVSLYSHSKRFTWACHFWLGSVLGLSVIAAFVAINPPGISWGAILLASGVALWTAGFDIIYAMQDLDFDRQAGLYSIPARFGLSRGLLAARIIHGGAFVCYALAGYYLSLSGVYFTGLIVAGGLLIYEHQLVRSDDLSRVNMAFFTVNGLLSIVVSGMGIIDVFY
jgi:4-hydroxybenzoate polyprenyltransferase